MPHLHPNRVSNTAEMLAVAVLALAFLSSCATVAAGPLELPPPEFVGRYGPEQERLSRSAREFIGARDRIVVDGVRFNADCSGAMLAVFYAAGLDLRSDFNRTRGENGVERFYRLMEGAGLLEETELPEPGSLVFWDDTYDRNEDGVKNDPLSHIGIVVSVRPTGDLSYVHYHYRNGVVEERMNIKRPSVHQEKSGGVDVTVNSPLRMRSWKPDGKSLSGELYRIGARAYAYAPRAD